MQETSTEKKLFPIFQHLVINKYQFFQILQFLSLYEIYQMKELCKSIKDAIQKLPHKFLLQNLDLTMDDKDEAVIAYKLNWYLLRIFKAKYNPAVIKLQITNSRYNALLIKVISNFFKQMIQYSNRLERLDIVNVWKNDFDQISQQIEYLLTEAKCAESLQYLNLQNCCTETAIEALSKFKKITHINISQNKFIQGQSLRDINLPRLQHINLLECMELQTSSIIQLVKNHSDTLKELIIDGENFEDQEFKQLSKYLPKIETLQITYGFKAVMNVPLLYSQTKFSTLQSYTFRKCQDLNPKQWELFFGHKFDKLKQLYLDNANLQDQGLFKIAKHCHEIEYIDLSWNCQLTNDSFQNFILCCWKLRSGKFIGLKGLTQEPLTKHEKYILPLSEELDFTSCNLVDQKKMENFFKFHPQTRVINYYHQLVNGPSNPNQDCMQF